MDDATNRLVKRFSFTEDARTAISGVEHWNERELQALCCGVPPEFFADSDDVAPEVDRNDAKRKIAAAINTGMLYARRNPAAGAAAHLYGGVWLIKPVDAIRWAISRFPKFPGWLVNANLKQIYAEQEEEKRLRGRYTIAEAAELIAEATGERVETIGKKLEAAASRHELPMYEPGKQAKYEYGQNAGQASRVRTFYEECHWDDLNAWLATNEPRLRFVFPDPETDSQAKTEDQTPQMGLTKEQILLAFGELISSDLGKAMADGAKWLEDARLVRGTRGGRHLSRWDPIVLAIALQDQKGVSVSKLNYAFNTYDFLSPWSERWREIPGR